MDAFEITGLWWLPESPDRSFAGTLRFTQDGPTLLDLVGSFDDPNALQHFPSHPIIHGVADAKKWTLVSNSTADFSIQFPGIVRAVYSPHYFLSGQHFAQLEDVRFYTLTVGYDYLTDWASTTGISITNSPVRNDPAEPSYRLEYRKPAPISVMVGDLAIKLEGRFRADGMAAQHVSVEETMGLSVSSPLPLTLLDYLTGMIGHLRNFLTFGVGRPIRMTFVEGQHIAGPIGGRETVRIFFAQSGDRSGRRTRLHVSSMRLPFSTLADNWGEYLQQWVARAEILGPVHNLYFSTINAPTQYVESRFLSLVQALETYHRRTRAGRYLETTPFLELRERLVAALSPTVTGGPARDAMEGKLGYLNEYSLRKRILDLSTEHREILTLVIPDIPAFVKTVVATRNYLTHYDTRPPEAASGTHLSRLADQVACAIDVCLMSELGFTTERIRALFDTNQDYLHLRRLIHLESSHSAEVSARA